MNAKASHYLQKFSIYIVLVILFIACSLISPYFIQSSNLINVARQLCVGILIAYGEMLLIVSGFLDLSVGSVLALAGLSQPIRVRNLCSWQCWLLWWWP